MFQHVLRDRMPVIERFVRSGRVLDVGCVDARNAKESAEVRIEHKPNLLFKRICQLNPDTVGLDIDEAGVKALRSVGFNVLCGDAQAVDLGREFDTIVAGEVIEHVESSGLFLRNMRRHLADGGVLIVSTPNPFYVGQAWKIWRYGRPAVHEDHVGWQDPITLQALLRRTGFEPFEGYWIQPETKLLKTWKRVFRPYFSHAFMVLARKSGAPDAYPDDKKME